MRPPRILILVAFALSALFTICISLRSRHTHSITASTVTSDSQSSRLRALFSLRAPFSLFPPNAIITLTHDNTTAFLARPAAFGPPLPSHGLKGQLWIGSGFGDDSLRQGGVASLSEGELGCSDVLGYTDGSKSPRRQDSTVRPADTKAVAASSKFTDSKDVIEHEALNENSPVADKPVVKSSAETTADDGTDDYLSQSSSQSPASQSDKQGAKTKSDHADIQSLQEGAEIAGKVVLLSRGGCGFLEKVKWAQRRGAIALVVGDDVKGGPLIQMYARGDTSNVTIPSIFTSHTTAHLLSSLMGTDAFLDDMATENRRPVLPMQHRDKKGSKKSPNVASSHEASKKATRGIAKSASKSTSARKQAAPMHTQKPGWFSSWYVGTKSSKSDDRRPPSSGQLDWALANEAKAPEDLQKSPSAKGYSNINLVKDLGKGSHGGKQSHGDDFQIGVEDWRDPDLVGSTKGSSNVKGDPHNRKMPNTKAEEKLEAEIAKSGGRKLSSAGKKAKGRTQQDQGDHTQELKGGSIVPGSGEYEVKSANADRAPTKDSQQDASFEQTQSTSLWGMIFGSDIKEDSRTSSETSPISADDQAVEFGEEEVDEMEGLWVTLTPTSGASPFLDTLLVLVVSPLVTLTVVYALLLIRSRIRRRRWRAPKSVVERLPVRTYQTISTPGNRSPRLPSPTSATPSTPLLQRGATPRPRSRTTTGIPDSGLSMTAPISVPIMTPLVKEHEKSIGGSGEWRKFMGRQVECVVCLEEYVDGVSRVMSLPCGHEFHVDCITPWLTTRRRTCPICKGDVVRSLARASPSSARYENYHSDSENDDSQRRNQEEHDPGMHEDVERGTGTASPTGRRREQSGVYGSSWRNMLASSLGSIGSLSRSPRITGSDGGNGQGQDRSR